MLVGAMGFSVLQTIQTSYGVHIASYVMNMGGSFPGAKWPGHEVDPSPQLLLSLRMSGTIHLHPLYACMLWTGKTFLKFFNKLNQFLLVTQTRV
jgi:hypothetical protein